jgi:superfamily II DNA or RNA helicase
LITQTNSGLPLRQWQSDCLNVLFNEHAAEKNYTVVATMGSGKTFLQGAFARHLIDNDMADVIINIVPSDTLRTSNAKALKTHFHLDISKKAPKPSDTVDGYVTTYQMLSNPHNALKLLGALAGKRIILMADEVHHGSANSKAKWGKAIQVLLENSTYSLMLSGTMWRSDSKYIRGVRYSNVELKDGTCFSYVDPHFEYTLKTASEDKVVSDVYFNLMKGSVILENEEDGEENVISPAWQEPKSFRQTLVLDGLLDPTKAFCKKVLEDADDALVNKIHVHRQTHPCTTPPGGLVVASTTKDADAIAVALEELTGEKPVVVHGKNEGSKQLIEGFSEGTLGRWMVAVGMVSEGVDVPRIKVLAYLTNKRTELLFHQIVGRSMRVRKNGAGDLIDEDALVFAPHLPDIHHHVTEFVNSQGGFAVADNTTEEPKEYVKGLPDFPVEVATETFYTESELYLNGMQTSYDRLVDKVTNIFDSIFSIFSNPQAA